MGKRKVAAFFEVCVARTPAKLYFISPLSSVNKISLIKP